MSGQGSAGNLALASRTLNLNWEKTKDHWRDSKSSEFEQKYLADLPGQVAAAITAMEELEQLIKKVRTDCE